MSLASRRRASLSVFTAAATLVAAAGCGVSSDRPVASPREASSARAVCEPPAPTLSAANAVAGATIVVSDAGLRCQPRLPAHETLTISLQEPLNAAGDHHQVRLAKVLVGSTARFRVAVRLPTALTTGIADVVVTGRALDRRTTCPANASCARFGSGIRIVSAAGS